MTSTVILFLKFPEPGRVKTRLAVSIGAEPAAQAYREMVAHVCRQLEPLPDLDIAVFYDPPEDRSRVLAWLRPLLPRRFRLIPQAAGNLGDRLAAAFGLVFDQGSSRAIVIGTDCVEIRPETLGEALSRLDRAHCVIGPTADGGYYLLGLRRPAPALFENIAWSTEETLPQTLRAAETGGLSVQQLSVRHDVDTAADWRRAQDWLAAQRRPDPSPSQSGQCVPPLPRPWRGC